MDKQYNARTRRTQGRPQSVNTHRTTQKDTKKVSNSKTQGHDGIHRFWFKKFTSIHDRLALEINRCLQGAYVPDWMTKWKTTLIQKDPSKGTAQNIYRLITCLPMYGKYLPHKKGRDLPLANKPQIVPWRTEKMPERIQRHSRVILHRSTHPKWEQDQIENLAIAWIDCTKSYDMVPQAG